MVTIKKDETMSVRKLVTGVVLLAIAGFVGLTVYFSRTQWIPAGHVGVIFTPDGLQKQVITPRRVWVPFRSQLFVYPTMLQAAIYSNDPLQGEVRAADAVNITTSDNANTPFDVVVWYRVRPEDVHTLFNTFRAIPITEIQSQHIRAAVREAANNIGPRYDAFGLMGPKRIQASALISDELKQVLGRKGITVERAELAGAYPTEEILKRITSRVNSYTDLEISRIKRDIARVQRDTALVKARAENEANRLTSAVTSERSLELLKLETELAAIERWDGRVPPIQPRPGQTLVISPDLLNSLSAQEGVK